jgi:pyrroloquinoline quinone (PQQ) biosynthesis protein C
MKCLNRLWAKGTRVRKLAGLGRQRLSGQRGSITARVDSSVDRKISSERCAVEEVEDALAYLVARPEQARRDRDFAPSSVKSSARTPEAQCAALDALTFKDDVLWAMSDALVHAYVEGHIPPVAWGPERP